MRSLPSVRLPEDVDLEWDGFSEGPATTHPESAAADFLLFFLLNEELLLLLAELSFGDDEGEGVLTCFLGMVCI